LRLPAFSDWVRSELPLKLKPTRIGESLYLLIPKPLKDIFEIRDDTRFIMLFEADAESCKLVYLSNRKEARERSIGAKASLRKQG